MHPVLILPHYFPKIHCQELFIYVGPCPIDLDVHLMHYMYSLSPLMRSIYPAILSFLMALIICGEAYKL